MAFWDHEHDTACGPLGNAQGPTLETHWHFGADGYTGVAANVTYPTVHTATHNHYTSCGPITSETTTQAVAIGVADMSNLVFPQSLPGFGIEVTKAPYFDVLIDESKSGKELRSSYWASPRYDYEVRFNFARNASTYTEVNTLADFFVRHFGQMDSFLLSDPDDGYVTAQGFGTGDGTTVAFQLQRKLCGQVWDNTGGPWRVTSTGRTNLCLYSQAFTNATWTKTNLTLKNTVPAADGTYTAQEYQASAAGSVAQTVSGLTAGAGYVLSVWARCPQSQGTTAKLTTSTATGTSETITPAWTRIELSFTADGATSTVTIGSIPTGALIQLWGAQVEAGSTPTQYIATVAAQVLSQPYYWPEFQDGFEPVYYLDGPPTIYKDGVAQSYTSQYTINSLGMVTFVVAPADDAQLTWTGDYYKRVRFAEKGLSLQRIVDQIWSAGSIKLLSVKP